MAIKFKQLPFDEAIKYLEQKVNLPTEKWTDIWQGMHSRAFVIAGAAKNAILTDFHNSINDAIKNGKTLNDFRKDFDTIVAKNGWSYKGSSGWRSAVIFDTNMRVAYAAGNYKQMTDKDVLAERTYWRYIGGLSEQPRPLHLSWSGTVLPANDSWWNTHYPPNGWGCKCKVVSQSASEIKRDGFKIADSAPEDGTYKWENPDTGEVIDVPNGIDPGWAYNPGKTAWGDNLSQEVMDAYKAGGEQRYERLTQGNWESEGLLEKIHADKTETEPDFKIDSTKSGIQKKLQEILGGEEKQFSFQADKFRYDINVNAKTLAKHLTDDKAPYLTFLNETLIAPQEIWMSFEKDIWTGKTVLRQRIIKVIDAKKNIFCITEAMEGQMQAWTIVPNPKMSYLNNQRVGKLIWKRD